MEKLYFRTVDENNQTYGNKGYFAFKKSIQITEDQQQVQHSNLRDFVYTDPKTEINIRQDNIKGRLNLVIGGSRQNPTPDRSVFSLGMASCGGDLASTDKDGNHSSRPGQVGLTNKPKIYLEYPYMGEGTPSWWEGSSTSEEAATPGQPLGSEGQPPGSKGQNPEQTPKSEAKWPFPPNTNNEDLVKQLIVLYNQGQKEFLYTYLRSAKLNKVELKGKLDFRYSYFHEAQFQYANFNEVDLSFCYFCEANFLGANLMASNLAYSYFCYAYLGYGNLSYAYLSHTNLCYANLTNTNLSNANLTNADLSYANLTSADLSNADLTGANLRGANFTGANLTGAKLDVDRKQLLGSS